MWVQKNSGISKNFFRTPNRHLGRFCTELFNCQNRREQNTIKFIALVDEQNVDTRLINGLNGEWTTHSLSRGLVIKLRWQMPIFLFRLLS